MLGCHRQTNQSAAVLRHEIDDLRRNLLSGHSQVTFVFAIFIVDNDYHLPRAYRRNGIFDACECARAAVAFSNNLKSSSHGKCFHNNCSTQCRIQAITDVSPLAAGLLTMLSGTAAPTGGEANLR